jgi:hypothetical protein
MPKAMVNLRETGRFFSQAMPVTPFEATQHFIGEIRRDLSTAVSWKTIWATSREPEGEPGACAD